MNAIPEQATEIPRVAQPVTLRLTPRALRTAGLAGIGAELFAAHDPDGARSEALRELRCQLMLRWFGDCRTLAVLGGHGRDEASVVAGNLAIVMAQLGTPTLLIDADLRAPRLHSLFGLEPPLGLADVLENCDVYDDAVSSIEAVRNLQVLCAGSPAAHPQELVSRTSFTYLMKTLPDRFGAVIVTAPPVLEYGDAQMIAARALGCLLVTRRHRTSFADVARIRSQLEPARALLLGGVVRE